MNDVDFRFPELDARAAEQARARQEQLTKPRGSLGRLEALAVQIAALQSSAEPSARPSAALLFAADHPVTRQGVSAYPSVVTKAMLHNFASGGAAANVLASAQHMPLYVVDVGVFDGGIGEYTNSTRDVVVTRDPVADLPAGDLRDMDAMSRDTFERCVAAGRCAVSRLGGDLRVLVLGEMGIGNSTAAAAVCAAIVGGDPADFVGAGAGASEAILETKRQVVRRAVSRLGQGPSPVEALRRVGGREMAAIFGAMQQALSQRTLLIVDGFIVTAAVLVLHALDASVLSGMVFAHRSAERAHGRVLEHLGVAPLLDLGLRLGEGTGALVAFSLVEHACELHNRMATFTSASVPDRSDVSSD